MENYTQVYFFFLFIAFSAWLHANISNIQKLSFLGMLKHIDGFVMKPVQNNHRGKTEMEFYEQIFHSTHPVISKLKHLIPHFFGLHQFVSDMSGKNGNCSTHFLKLYIFFKTFIKYVVVHYFIKMEDIAGGMAKPCIADIKIGRQTWDPHSSTEKQLAENVKIFF